MKNRREFVVGSLLAGAAAAAGVPVGAMPRPARPSRPGIEPGLQLYTVRELLEKNFAGTLEKVAEIGYREVQVSPRAGKTPQEIRKMLDDAGLVCPSMHLDLRTPLNAEIEAATVLGAKTAFLSIPIQVLNIENGEVKGFRDDVSLDEWKKIAESLNQMGEACRTADLVFGYHNHAVEFRKTDGVLPFDLVLEQTDPELVAIEIDLGWAHIGGVDPVPYFEKYPGRFPVCHVKDVNADGSFADPGKGVVDLERAFAAAEVAGLEHFFVEHDTTTDPLATAAVGYAFLRGVRVSGQ
jgi:sugar phosphate isomerase/epimerase